MYSSTYEIAANTNKTISISFDNMFSDYTIASVFIITGSNYVIASVKDISSTSVSIVSVSIVLRNNHTSSVSST